MSTLRRLRGAAAAAALVVAGLGATTSQPAVAEDTSATSNRPPVAVDDEITVYPNDQVDLDLLANDSDPDGDAVGVCRFGTPTSHHLWVGALGFVTPGEPAPIGIGEPHLAVDGDTPTGDYTFPYQACDTEFLTAATVTVHVRRLPEVTVRRTSRPGFIRVHNPSGFRARFDWYGPGGVNEHDTVLRPHSSRTVGVWNHRISWYASTAGGAQHALGSGGLRHIALLRRRYDVPPGTFVIGRTASRPQPTAPADETGATPVTWPASTFTNPDPATTHAPVTDDDAAAVWSGGQSVSVLGNDTDPEGVGVEVCRVDAGSVAGSGLVPTVSDGWLDLDSSHAAAGTYALTYFACNAHRLTPATVTVTVRRTRRLEVTVVAGHRSHVLVTNPNAAPAHVLLNADVDGFGASGTATVPANASKYVAFHHRWGTWNAFVGCGGNAGHGQLRDVPLTRGDAAKDTSTRGGDLVLVLAVGGC